MVKLTEEMVCARTRVSDFSVVKKLNCWGAELTDVSLLRQMKNVEVLSLSVNSINTLADIQYCINLRDLFVRKNDIRDINEVCYLQGLPNLRNLWLGENPCAEGKGYRMAVLRALPNLEKLDDKIVSSEEVDVALTNGHVLYHPLDSEPSPRQLTPDSPEESSEEIANHDQDYQDVDRTNANCETASPPRHYQQNYQCIYDEYEEQAASPRSNCKYQERSVSPEYASSEPNHRTYMDNNSPRTHHPSEHVDDRHSERNTYDYDNRRHVENSEPVPQPRRISSYQNLERDDTRLESSQLPGWVKYSDKETCTASRFLYQRRPVTRVRNSNILSAVLCLVKELDYPSLEVVEMAVRSRMDEIEQ